MSSCLSRGGRAYGLELEIIKSTSSASSTNYQSSPSSSSGNSPLAISTRKPRTPRKRPNQTYNEAVALLSTAYPYLFPPKNFTKPPKFTKPQHHSLFHDSSESLLFPLRVIHNSDFLLHNQSKPVELKVENVCNKWSWANDTSSGEVNSHGAMEREMQLEDDFDVESILEEESGEGRGIDSIMGKLSARQETWDEEWNGRSEILGGSWHTSALGLRKGVGALRQVEQQANWWNFSTVDLQQISPETNTGGCGGRAEKKKRKKKNKGAVENLNPGLKLKLKLNYEEVVNAWFGSPFSHEPPPRNGVYMDLLSEAEGGVREASVLRYKQKRHTRLFSTTISVQWRIQALLVEGPVACSITKYYIINLKSLK
ncbi:hypothetical protein V6N13_144601 [Hibiscus sabdariffa]|uniref:Uncharacterized protein n=1 Tax=Hibiscus sabdariffa TaxID=183260 RepID=A0ABR2FKU9_9ROSI